MYMCITSRFLRIENRYGTSTIIQRPQSTTLTNQPCLLNILKNPHSTTICKLRKKYIYPYHRLDIYITTSDNQFTPTQPTAAKFLVPESFKSALAMAIAINNEDQTKPEQTPQILHINHPERAPPLPTPSRVKRKIC